IVQNVLGLPEGERVMILAPIVRGRKGEFKKELEKLAKDGFLRARVDGELFSLDEEIRLDKRKNHTIEAVIDRLLIKPGIKDRLTESIRTALKLTGGAVLVSIVDGEEKLFSERMACVNCGINIAPLEPRSFSFNSAYGACKRCQGLGTVMEIDAGKIVPDPSQSAAKVEFLGGVDKAGGSYLRSALNAIIEKLTDGDKLGQPEDSIVGKIKKKLSNNGNADAKRLQQTPFADLPKEIRDAFFHGTKRRLTFRQGTYKYEGDWKGALRVMRDRMEDPPSEKTRVALEELVAPVSCPVCDGQRLQPESLAVKVAELGIGEYTELPISEAVGRFDEIKLTAREEKIAGLVLKEIRDRL